ncbi:MAG: hypothetical protein E7346_06765 [Clostridiales bacterium]|nr:hypothetical protein [Clostridiales bacterium]
MVKMSSINKIIDEIKKELNLNLSLENIEFIKTDSGLKVERKNSKITVFYSKKSDIARSLLLIKANQTESDYSIKENYVFEDVCLMIDCSRNAVRNVETVKKLIRNIAVMGYNSLMLYTEDTYEVNNEPMFGYLRGRYSKSELKELDAYAKDLGIELIPCVQTLAHLNQLTRYSLKHFNCFDCSDILLVGHERTYELIDNIFSTLAECFSSRIAHIGMDEAWLLGRGKYLMINGYKNPFDIILSHLYKICEIAEKYGITPMIWSDMFWRIAYADENCKDADGKVKIPKEILEKIPKNLILCHWDYHSIVPEGFTEKLEIHKQFENEIWFAGGTSMDNRGFIPLLSYSMNTAKAAIKEAKKFGIKHLVETSWGDNGGECAIFSQLPAIMQYSYTALGVEEERLKKEFETLTGYEFDDFIKIEHGQNFCGKHKADFANPLKYGLYNDVFSGYVDVVINAEDKVFFAKAKDEIKNMFVGQYGYLFETAYALNDLMFVKYDLGIRLRKAYQEKNLNELKVICLDIDTVINKLEKFIQVYRRQWLKENKPNGLEIQEIRLGGLKERLTGCRLRLEEYLQGVTKTIPELEETLNKDAVSRIKSDGRCDLFSYMAIASVNSFDGFIDVDV